MSKVFIVFMDGKAKTVERVDSIRIEDDTLKCRRAQYNGGIHSTFIAFPLVNVKSYEWRH